MKISLSTQCGPHYVWTFIMYQAGPLIAVIFEHNQSNIVGFEKKNQELS